MQPEADSGAEIEWLRSHAGRLVGVRLGDGSEMFGTLRTELLTERSISVFLQRADGEGATLYIDDIVEVWPTS